MTIRTRSVATAAARLSLVLASLGILATATRVVAPGEAAAQRKQQRRKPAMAAAPKPRLTAQQVLERFTQAVGGKAAFEAVKSTVMKGTISMKPQGLQGTMEAYTKEPNKLLVVQNLPGIGLIRQGFDGKTGWAQDPISGVRTLEGNELAAMRRGASAGTPRSLKEPYKKIEMLGLRKVDGRNAYALRLTPLTGKPMVQFYDAATFLLVKMEMVVDSPQGTFPVEAYLSDYRVVEGIKMPFKNRASVGGIAEILSTVTELKTNVPVEDALFAKPDPSAAVPTPPAPGPPPVPPMPPR